MGASLSVSKRKIKVFHRLIGVVAFLFGLTGQVQAQDEGSRGADLSGVYYTQHPPETLKPIDGHPVPLTDAGRAALAANAPKSQQQKFHRLAPPWMLAYRPVLLVFSNSPSAGNRPRKARQ